MTFLYLNSDVMGQGDPELGRRLLVSFLRELVAAEASIDLIGCVHRGVYLTTEGSEVLDSLEALQARGARIATCGTCLDHFALRESLKIGEIGTMDGTAAVFLAADRVIRPC